MTPRDEAVYAAVAVLLVAIFLVPKWVSLRHRAIVGAALFIIGWVGVFGGLALSDQPFLQSETIAVAWMSVFALLLVGSVVFLVSAAVDCLRLKRGSRKSL